jgi:hypothetical protein
LVSSLGCGAGLGAPKSLKPLKPLKPVELAGSVCAGTPGLPNAPKNEPPAGLATPVEAGGAPKSGPVVGAAMVIGV